MDDHSRIVVGVSACLLGERVRHDGGHCRDPYVAGQLSRQFHLVAICPEVEIGLGVPRRPIRLVRTPQGVCVRDAGTPGNAHLDYTERLRFLARELAPHLAKLSGYIFKTGSPSCGLREVRLYDGQGGYEPAGIGEYARMVKALCPWMPMVDETQLADPDRRQRFIEDVYALRRWQDQNPEGLGARRQVSVGGE
jgi:uncharacterized protein YbbK (DUF523 family)